jgi:hypothetical protein
MAIHGATLRSHFWSLLPAVALFTLLLTLPALLNALELRLADAEVRDVLAEVVQSLGEGYYGFIGSAVLLTLWLMLEPLTDLPPKMVAAGAGGALAMSAFLFPAVADSLQGPVKEAALLARERGYAVVAWGINVPSFSVYYGRATPQRRPEAGEVLLTRARRLPELATPQNVLYQRRGIVLVQLPR